jgi:hypothetical protein
MKNCIILGIENHSLSFCLLELKILAMVGLLATLNAKGG